MVARAIPIVLMNSPIRSFLLGEFMLDTQGIKQFRKHAISIVLQHVL